MDAAAGFSTSWCFTSCVMAVVLDLQQLCLGCRQRLGKLKALVGPMLERLAESKERPRALEAARSFLDIVGKSANAWEAIKPWVNHTQRLGLLAQVRPMLPASLPVSSAYAAHGRNSRHQDYVCSLQACCWVWAHRSAANTAGTCLSRV